MMAVAHNIRPDAARRRGFTLLEVVLAVALSGMLLLAVNFFVLGLGELWGRGSEPRLFDRHVRGVTRFLEALVDQAVVPTEDPAQATAGTPTTLNRAARRRGPEPMATQRRPLGAGASGAAIGRWLMARASERIPAGPLWLGVAARALRVQAPPDRGGMGRLPSPVRDANPNRPPALGGAPNRAGLPASGGGEVVQATGARFHFGTPSGYDGNPPMLMFEIDEAPGQCVWPLRPLPQVECALQINADEGLVLLWKSKLEDDYGTARPRKTQLSPFGRTIAFDYYDAERRVWTRSDQPQSDGKGGWVVPQRVRFTFVYGGIEREVSITLPETPGGAPLR